MIKIHILRCGIVGTDECIPDSTKSKNPYAYTGLFRGKRHRVSLPVFAYLIEHPKGKILVDTGWHKDVRIDAKNHLGWKLNFASKAKLPEGEAIDEQLEQLDLKPEDIDIVLLTHLDVDHASGIKQVKDAKCFYANKNEIEAMKKGNIRYLPSLWQGIDIQPYPLERNKKWPNKEGFDVFQDGTVQFIDLSGHSAGNTGVFVQHNDKFVIITGDACYSPVNWQEEKLPGLVTNTQHAYNSIHWIKEMSQKENCVAILASHDPNIQPQTIEI